MSSIDERIVELKFNNTQFEAGIKTTMASLDGLKRSLKFDTSIKGLGDLSKAAGNVKLNVNGEGVANTAKTVMSSVSNMIKGLADVDRAGKGTHIKLDAKYFQDGAKGIIDAAANLKTNLNFKDIGQNFKNIDFRAVATQVQSVVKNAITSLSELDGAGNRVSFQGMSDSIDNLRGKFEGLSVVGIAALATIGAKAATVGMGMAKSLFIDNPKSGLAEYETNLNSIQTILANTQSKGSTLADVNGALQELNEYSDQTIYNFAEMARNIGTFTAAGVDLDTSTSAIKGIANLAAMSGSNSVQAATAMQQLSQELAAGKVTLMGWNSVVTAGMGGETFQNALKETARNQGIAVDSLIEKNGSFRDSLQEGWLTSKVLTSTLSKFTGDMTDDQLRSMGYNEKQIKGIQKMAETAKDAATKVKTFTQLMGTMQETSGSGWAQSMQLILGDFEQAKAMWTNVNDVLGGMISASADRRNKMLGDWNELGGREVMIEAVANAFKALMGIITPVTKAFREVFPPTTGKKLYDITVAIRNFTAALIPGAATTSILHNTFQLLFTIIKIGLTIVGGFLKVIGALFGAIFLGGKGVSDAGKSIGDFIGFIADAIGKSEAIPNFFDMLIKGATALGTGIRNAMVFIAPFVKDGLVAMGTGIRNLAQNIQPFIKNGLGKMASGLRNVMTFLGQFGSMAGEAVRAFVAGGLDAALTRVRLRLESFGRLGGVLGKAWNNIVAGARDLWADLQPLVTALGDMFKDIGKHVGDALKDVKFNDVLDIVNVGLLGGLVLMFRNFFKKGLGIGDGLKDGILSQLGDTLGGVQDALGQLTGTLEAMQKNLEADTLMKIAIAIGVLTASVVVLSMIDSAALTKSLIAIGIMFVMLNKSMAALDGLTGGAGFIKLPFIAASMILLATAIVILATAVRIMSGLSWEELLKGLFGVSVLLIGVAKAAEIMARNPANLIATGIGMMAIAVAVKILASAVGDMAELNFGEMIQGLIGIGGVIGALLLFNNLAKVNKGSMANAAGLILLGIALKIMASAVGDFAAMDMGQLVQGVATLAAVLFVVAAFVNATGKNTNIIQAAISLTILGVAMQVMATAIGTLGSMSWETLAKGLLSMAIALKAITVSMAMLPPNMLLNAIGMVAVGAALVIIAQALQAMGGMTWEEITKGLVTLGLSMLILAVGLNAMAATLPGAAAMLVAAGAMAVLVPVLMALSMLTWEQLLHGMAGLAAIFLIFGIAGLVLTPVVPTIMALGIAIGVLGLGLMGIGVGTMLFVTALLALAAAAVIAGPALVTFVTSILKLIPLALEQFGLGIVAFANVISSNAPVFLRAMVTLITTLLQAINILAPRILDTLWRLVSGLLDLLVRAVPKFVDAGMKILLGILRGIADNISQVVTAATDVIVNFIDGIAKNLPRIIESGANLIVSFVEGLAASVRQNSGRMTTAGLDLASAIIEGMVSGIGQGVGRVISAAKDMASSALTAAMDFLDINSPSKKFIKVGASTGEGFIKGIDSYGKMVGKAAAAMGGNAIDGTKKALDINSPSKEFQKLGEYTGKGFIKGLTGTKAEARAAFYMMRDLLTETARATIADVREAEERLRKIQASRKEDLKSLKKAEADRAKLIKGGKSTKTVDARIKKLKKTQATELRQQKAIGKTLATARLEYKKVNTAKSVLWKQLADDGKKVESLAGKHELLIKKVDEAKKKLEDATKTRNDYSASLRSQYSDIEDINENTRIKTYFKNLEQEIKETQEFATKIQELRKLGLNDTFYKELLAKGPETMPFIKELIAGGKDKVAELNSLQGQLDKEAWRLSKTAGANLYQAGVDSAKGLVAGLEKEQKNIKAQMDKIAGYMVKSIKKALGIKSPSREFMKVGKFTTEGLVKGLEMTAGAVAKASANVGDEAVNALRQSMNNMGSLVSADMDMTPTIRPVLDLTDIEKNSGLIGGLLGPSTITVDGSYAKAASLAASTRANQEAQSVATTSGDAEGKALTFNQYNNSPKALSRSEIYRQTKNQLSVVKGALTINA